MWSDPEREVRKNRGQTTIFASMPNLLIKAPKIVL
jgi:hypothetical protein